MGFTSLIESVGNQKIGIRTADGVEHKISREDIRFMDYGYTASTYSSQGKTSDYAIGIVRAKERFATLSHQRSFYVTLSRAAKEAHLVIDNYKDLIKSLGEKDGDKTSSIEHQTKLDKNASVVKDTANPEAKIRANIIKYTIGKLAIEYENIEKLKPSNESLSTSMKESVANFKSTQVDVIPITLNKLANISPFSVASFSNLILFFYKDIPSMYAGINYFINSFKNPILQRSTFDYLPSIFTAI